MNEDKADRYHRLKRRASLASLAWSATLLIALVLAGGSRALRDLAGEVAGAAGVSGEWLPATVVVGYVVLLAALHELVACPSSWYQGFVLERRYGLSTAPAGRWVRDHAKAVTLALGFAVLASSFVYLAIRRWPDSWWAIVAAGFTIAMILLTRVAPVLLLPLFYRFTPLAQEGLRARLLALADRAGTPVVAAFEWRVSDRTRKANAALAGLGRTRRILVSDTLLAEFSDEEIEVVLAHELGHHVHGDIWRQILYESALTFAGFYVGHRALLAAASTAGLREISDVAGLPLLLLSTGAVSLASVPALNALSRAHERRADCFALRLTGGASAFVSAMHRLAAQNLAEENPSSLVRALFHSHPTTKERIALAQRFLSTFTTRCREGLPGPHHQLAAHVAAPIVVLQVAVEGEAARLVGAKLEHDRLSGADPLRDAIGVNGDAVGDVVIPVKRDLDEVVLKSLDTGGRKGIPARRDDEVAAAGRLILNGSPRRRGRLGPAPVKSAS